MSSSAERPTQTISILGQEVTIPEVDNSPQAVALREQQINQGVDSALAAARRVNIKTNGFSKGTLTFAPPLTPKTT